MRSPRPEDRRDVLLLCRAFGLDLPQEYLPAASD